MLPSGLEKGERGLKTEVSMEIMPRQPRQPHQPTQLVNPNQAAITKSEKPLRNQDATEPISTATVVAKKGKAKSGILLEVQKDPQPCQLTTRTDKPTTTTGEILLSNRQDATEPTTAMIGRGKGKAKSRTSSGAQQYRSQSAPVRSSRHEIPEELCDGFHGSNIQEDLQHGLGTSQGSTKRMDNDGDSPKQSTNGPGDVPQRRKFGLKPKVAWSVCCTLMNL